jgi:hypothetical protein
MSDEFIIAGVVILAILFGGDPDLMDVIITNIGNQ